MPCDEVRTTVVNLEAADSGLLQAALKALGYDVAVNGPVVTFSLPGRYEYHRFANGQLQVSGYGAEQLANEIRRAYSGEVVKQAAQKFGWKVQTNPVKKYEYHVQRRR